MTGIAPTGVIVVGGGDQRQAGNRSCFGEEWDEGIDDEGAPY
jgi:hypothetical protein